MPIISTIISKGGGNELYKVSILNPNIRGKITYAITIIVSKITNKYGQSRASKCNPISIAIDPIEGMRVPNGLYDILRLGRKNIKF